MKKLLKIIKSKIVLRGFTLVELLAVIVILAIIMIIAIPSVLTTLTVAEKKSFVEYADKIRNVAEKEILEEEINGTRVQTECFIYDITEDFDFNTGKFKGYILIKEENKEKKYYISMYNDKYMLVTYNMTDGINYKGKKKSIDDSLEDYSADRDDELSIEYLCNFACTSCSYNSHDSDGGVETIAGDYSKIKGATILMTGPEVSEIFNTIAGGRDNIISIKEADILDENANKATITLNDGSSKDNPVYVWFNSGILYFYTDATAIYLNSDSSLLLSNMPNVTDLSGFINRVHVENVKSMQNMFRNDKAIKTIDLSSWKTSSLTNMQEMFISCTSVENLIINNLNTSNVTTLNNTFDNCESLVSIDLSKWNTENVKDLRALFKGCKNLLNANIGNWNTKSVTRIEGLFNNCHNIKTIDIGNWNISNVTRFGSEDESLGTFANCYKLENIDLSKWNTRRTTNLANVFLNCESLKTLDISNWDVSRVTTMVKLFSGTKSLVNIDVSKWNTGAVTNMSSLFEHTPSLNELNIGSWNVKNVTNMSNMFYDSGIRTLNINGWKTNSLSNINYIFYNSNLHGTLNLSSWNIDKVTSLNETFRGTKLEIIDITGWNTSQVKSMVKTFAQNSSLKHIYVGNGWSTSGLTLNTGVENAEFLFYDSYNLPRYNKNEVSYTKAHVGSGGYLEKK